MLKGKPIFRGGHLPEKVVFPNKNRISGTGSLAGKRVAAFAGIARPAAFRDTLISVGADPVYFREFRDHHVLSSGEIRELRAEKEKSGADYLVTTEKDWVRMGDALSGYPDLAYLNIRFSLLSGRERFFSMVKEKMGEV